MTRDSHIGKHFTYANSFAQFAENKEVNDEGGRQQRIFASIVNHNGILHSQHIQLGINAA
jgi:hypothetical protein